jgi:hypothetical protein
VIVEIPGIGDNGQKTVDNYSIRESLALEYRQRMIAYWQQYIVEGMFFGFDFELMGITSGDQHTRQKNQRQRLFFNAFWPSTLPRLAVIAHAISIRKLSSGF